LPGAPRSRFREVFESATALFSETLAGFLRTVQLATEPACRARSRVRTETLFAFCVPGEALHITALLVNESNALSDHAFLVSPVYCGR
jgi:hypothetical protein